MKNDLAFPVTINVLYQSEGSSKVLGWRRRAKQSISIIAAVGLFAALARGSDSPDGQTAELAITVVEGAVHLHYAIEPDKRITTVFQSAGLSSSVGQEWLPLRTFPPLRAAEGWIELGGIDAAPVGFFRVEQASIAIPNTMAWIPPGEFVMGSPDDEPDRYQDEGPQREVVIEEGFWLSKYEVTQREFQALMQQNPSSAKDDPNCPVERVTWTVAMQYCARLTEQESAAGRIPPGYVYRLPTEAEWEYACRAGTQTAYSFGDSISELSYYAWWADNGGPKPHPVGEKLPNPWGLYDMHGNVFEWCLDEYKEYPGGEIPGTRARRALRSGAFYCPASLLRSSCRIESTHAAALSPLIGFRVALAPVQPLAAAQAEFPTDSDEGF